MVTLGERFVYYRLPDVDQSKMAANAIEHAGHEGEIRQELSTLVEKFFASMGTPSTPPATSTAERDKLVALATFTTRCRSPVERDPYHNREIELIPGAESPTRVVKVLLQLLHGLAIIGVDRARAWELVSKVAMDSMPALRKKILNAMLESQREEIKTNELANDLGYPTNTTRRVLEDLACYGVVQRESPGMGKPDIWRLTDWARSSYRAATSTLPETLPPIILK